MHLHHHYSVYLPIFLHAYNLCFNDNLQPQLYTILYIAPYIIFPSLNVSLIFFWGCFFNIIPYSFSLYNQTISVVSFMLVNHYKYTFIQFLIFHDSILVQPIHFLNIPFPLHSVFVSLPCSQFHIKLHILLCEKIIVASGQFGPGAVFTLIFIIHTICILLLNLITVL